MDISQYYKSLVEENVIDKIVSISNKVSFQLTSMLSQELSFAINLHICMFLINFIIHMTYTCLKRDVIIFDFNSNWQHEVLRQSK